MASTDQAASYDLPFVELVYQYLPSNLKGAGKNLVMEWAKEGLIQRDRLVEYAMANASEGQYEVISENGRDHCDGTDTKTATVIERNKDGRTHYNVIVTNIKNKVGPLRIVAYNPYNGEFFYYFVHDYESVRSYDRLEFDIYSHSKYTCGPCGREFYSFKDLAVHTLSRKKSTLLEFI